MGPEAGGQSVIIRTRISHCDVLQSFNIHPLSPLKFTASHFIQGIVAILFQFKANLVALQAPPSTDIGVVIISQSYRKCSRWSKHPSEGSNILPHNANKAVPVFSSGHSFLIWNLVGKRSQIPSFLLYCSVTVHRCRAFVRPTDQYSLSSDNISPLPQRTTPEL